MADERSVEVSGLEHDPKGWRLDELALALEATILRGDGDLEILDFATLESAGSSDISFVTDRKALAQAAESRAAAFVVPEPLDVPDRPVLRVGEIWEAVCRLIEMFRPAPTMPARVDPSAQVGHSCDLGPETGLGPNAVLGANVSVGRGTRIGAASTVGDGVRIGEDCAIHAGVHILHNVTIGDRVVIHSGAVIGADGFKFERVEGRWKKIPQVGTVVIEDDVEIGANTTVDRAFLDVTRIGAGTKIDNLVQVAHNVEIGRGALLCAQVGISGSSILGDGCVLAGQAGVRDNARIGAGAQIAAQAGVKDDVPDGAQMVGTPAWPISEWSRVLVAHRKGPELTKRVRKLEKRLEKLEEGRDD
jgi:UDP-3-O-[3-hydroxymyristoyl] glucosamine N-acyltransferase